MHTNAAHVSLTELCLDYLSLPAFSHAVHDDQVREYSLMGTYAFFDYALASWTSHLEHALETCDLSASLPISLTQKLKTFFDMHWKDAKRQTRPTKQVRQLTDRIAHLETRDKIRSSMSSMHCLMTTNISDLESVYTDDLFSFLARARAVIESLALQPESMSEVCRFYGQEVYKCPRVYCRSFYEGFATMPQRDSHLERHDRSHHCLGTKFVHDADWLAPRVLHFVRQLCSAATLAVEMLHKRNLDPAFLPCIMSMRSDWLVLRDRSFARHDSLPRWLLRLCEVRISLVRVERQLFRSTRFTASFSRALSDSLPPLLFSRLCH